MKIRLKDFWRKIHFFNFQRFRRIFPRLNFVGSPPAADCRRPAMARRFRRRGAAIDRYVCTSGESEHRHRIASSFLLRGLAAALDVVVVDARQVDLGRGDVLAQEAHVPPVGLDVGRGVAQVFRQQRLGEGREGRSARLISAT